jgi:translation initiation factor IF-2
MRARGAKLTDVAILVIAADDGVMPQTIEAIDHIKAADVPMIVAVNKIDKPAANIDKVKQQLTEQGVVPEEWGGDTIVVSVSAKNNIGIATLLESVLLVADMKELKADPKRKAKGVVVEAKLDKGKGPVATVLIQNGTLKTGDTIVAGTVVGKLRALIDDSGIIVKQAKPSYAVSILGLSDVPNAGDFFYVVDEKLSKQVAEERKNKQAAQRIQQAAKFTLDDVFNKLSEGQVKALNVIIKADVQGSMEALKQSLIKISNEEVKINPIHGGVGAITETDIMLAKASGAVIIGFNIKADAKARQLSDKENVDIRHYRIIYEAIDDITKMMKGLLKPKFEELPLGKAQVRQLFKFEGTAIAGCMITEGKVLRNSKIRLLREGAEIYSGSISTLKRFKDDAKEVAAGYECGISLEGFNDIKENDIIEAYQIKEILQP